MCIAQILLYTREKFVEPMYLPKLPFSLLYHQTMSIMAANGSLQPRELARQVLTLSVFSSVTKEDYLALLRELLEIGHLERGEDGALLIGEKGEAAVNNYEFLAVFSVPVEFTVRNNSEVIGTVQNPFPPKSQFALAGQAWEVVELDKKAQIIYVKHVEGISANMWTDTGNEYVHTRVMKKILEVLTSGEEYGFMDESAKKRLSDVRALFGNAVAQNQDEHIVLPLSDTMYAVFPFIGTRGTMALLYALRERGFAAEVYLSRYIPVCIEVHTDRGKRALVNALDEIKRGNQRGTSVIGHRQQLRSHLLLAQLLRKLHLRITRLKKDIRRRRFRRLRHFRYQLGPRLCIGSNSNRHQLRLLIIARLKPRQKRRSMLGITLLK